eukprot:scaffold6387_cov171-Amphora_coffeaeformis.AAC.2
MESDDFVYRPPVDVGPKIRAFSTYETQKGILSLAWGSAKKVPGTPFSDMCYTNKNPVVGYFAATLRRTRAMFANAALETIEASSYPKQMLVLPYHILLAHFDYGQEFEYCSTTWHRHNRNDFCQPSLKLRKDANISELV